MDLIMSRCSELILIGLHIHGGKSYIVLYCVNERRITLWSYLSLFLSPPAGVVTRRAVETATRRPQTPSSSTGKYPLFVFSIWLLLRNVAVAILLFGLSFYSCIVRCRR